MRMMKGSSLLIGLGLGFALAGGPALAQDAPPAGKQAADTGKLSQQDQQFIQQAALDNMFEVRLGQLGLEKAQSKTVRDFAGKMVKDHSSSMSSLSKIAQKNGVELPAKISDDQQAIYDRLSQLSGKDFDTAYMEQVTQQHQTALNAFQRASEEAQDKDLRNYAKSTIPTLRKHQDLAKRDSKKM